MVSKKVDWLFLIAFLVLICVLFLGVTMPKASRQFSKPETTIISTPASKQPVFIQHPPADACACDCGEVHK